MFGRSPVNYHVIGSESLGKCPAREFGESREKSGSGI